MAYEIPTPRVTNYNPRKHGAACDLCPLNGNRVVPPLEPQSRSGRVKLVVVGEGPGASEENQRRPFVGRSGISLNQNLAHAGIDRDDCWITNAALCRGDSDADNDAAAAYCAPRLIGELGKLPPEAPLMLLGKSAARSVLGVKSILMARGFLWEARDLTANVKAAAAAMRKAERLHKGEEVTAIKLAVTEGRHALRGRMVFPTLHPAFVLRSELWKPILELDVQRVGAWMRGELTVNDLADRGPYRDSDLPKVIERELRRLGDLISCDIETGKSPRELLPGVMGKAYRRVVDPLTVPILCVGLSDGKNTFVIGPWNAARHKDLLTAALAKRTTSWHNGYNFDHIALERDGVVIPTDDRTQDTLIAHHAFASHLPQRLDHVVSVFLPITAPWKVKFGKRSGAEEKAGAAADKLSIEERHRYNASDCIVQARTWDALQADLEPERAVYEHDKKLAVICKQMIVAGIRRDERIAKELALKIKRKAAALKGEMRRIAREKDYSPLDNRATARILFRKFRTPITSVTEKGAPSTSRATLENLAGAPTRAGRFADRLLRWRGLTKAKSTYLDGIAIGEDGRFHPNWRPYGTVTGRLSSRAQSIYRLVPTERALSILRRNPKMKLHEVEAKIGRDATYELESRMREVYIPAAGCGFLYFDLKQSEMNAAAYLSGDPNFIRSCKTGDIHTANAKILFPDKLEVLNRDPKGEGSEWRNITKNAGFGILYDAKEETIFAFLRDKGMPVTLDSVRAMFSFIREEYAGYYRYCAQQVERCRRDGYLRTALLGRIRYLGFACEQTTIYNFKVQSCIADLMNLRLIELVPRLPKGARPIFQGHDSLLIEAPLGEGMRTARKLVEEQWAEEIFIPESGQRFVMGIDLKEGERMSDF